MKDRVTDAIPIQRLDLKFLAQGCVQRRRYLDPVSVKPNIIIAVVVKRIGLHRLLSRSVAGWIANIGKMQTAGYALRPQSSSQNNGFPYTITIPWRRMVLALNALRAGSIR